MDSISSIFKKGPWRNLIILAVMVIVLLLLKPWVQIGPGERGIVLNFGAVQPLVLNEGIHFRIPLMQQIIIMDVKIQKAETDAASASRDRKSVV